MNSEQRSLRVFCAGLMVVWATNVCAEGNATGNVVSSIALMESCLVHEESLTGSTAMMRFGPATSVAGGESESDAVTGAPDGAVAELECSPDVGAVSISVNRGDHSALGAATGIANRAMQGSSTSVIPYEIYQDHTHGAMFPASGSAGLRVPSDGEPVALPIYGRVNSATTAAPPTGNFSDVLRVMLSW